jgi:hypothetical protein
MLAKLNHVAIVLKNYALLSVWYRAAFGLEVKTNAKFEASAMSIGEGYLGMNVVDVVRERVAKKYRKVEIIQRPSNRPFAALGMHERRNAGPHCERRFGTAGDQF